MSNRPPGVLFVLSAPSGTGKTTVAAHLQGQMPDLRLSRSYTSRAPRHGEADGVDYHFISRAEFEARIARGEFLEWADVFGNLYGTSAADTAEILASGRDVLLVIDVQGARQVRAWWEETVTVFVLPPSFEELERRLRGRSRDAEPVIQERLAVARHEVAAFVEYDYVLVNDELLACADEMRGIILAERAKVNRRRHEALPILETFHRTA